MDRITNKETNRNKLLDQGVAMLMQQGFHGTGIMQLVDSVNIPKGSFYNYFASKENFGAEVVQHYIDPFIGQLNRHLLVPNQTAALALRNYFQELIEELESQNFQGGCLLGNLIGEIGDTSETCAAALKSAVRQYRDTLAKGIERGQSEGCIRADLAADEMADLLLDSWQGALLRMKIEKSTKPLNQCCGQLLDGWFKTNSTSDL